MIRRTIPAALVLMTLLVLPAGALEITNYRGNEQIRYPVALIRGTLAPAATEITLLNASSSRPTQRMTGQARAGRFKVLAELVPGANRLTLRAGSDVRNITLRYLPQTNPYFVRCIYHVDSTGDTRFESPLPDDPQNYAGKLDTAMKLMQTMTAERMNDLGFGRRTFNLELDKDGRVVVHVVKAAVPAETYWALTDLDWWSRIEREMRGAYPTDHAKNLVVAAYTRYDRATRKARGHTALGGGGLALFGSGSMFAWPDSLQQAQPAFMNATRIDPATTLADDAGRNAFWASASTTIGACLHETGHTFGLPHSREPMDIMTRGFDHFNRVFTLAEPARNGTLRAFDPDRQAAFMPVSAAFLVNSRYFALDRQDYQPRARIRARREEEGKTVVFTSDRPIRYVGFIVKGDAVTFEVPAPGTRQIRYDIAVIQKRLKSEQFSITCQDDQDNTRHERIGK